jgi:ATP-binding cassette, subfamily B, bacterial
MNLVASLRKRLSIFLVVRLAAYHVWKSGPALMVGTSVLLVAQSLVPLLALYLTKVVVDAITTGIAATDKAAAFQGALWAMALAAGVGVISACLSFVHTIVRELQQIAFQDHMQGIILGRSIELDLEYYENSKYYDSLHRAQQEGLSRPVSIVHNLIQICQNSISLLAVATLLIAFHWSVGVILLVAAVPGVVVRLRFSEKLYAWHRERSFTERLAAYFQFLLTSAVSAKEIRIFKLGSFFINRHRELRNRLRYERVKMSASLAAKELLTKGGGAVVMLGVFAVLSWRAVQGQLSLGDLVLYYQGIQAGIGFLGMTLSGMTNLYQDSLFLSNLSEFLSLEKKVPEPKVPKPLPLPLHQGIVFDRVSFSYPGDGRTVLRDVSLTIRPGQTIAVVGKNGAGKTTLIKLLCRLYDPTAGTISIDGVDLRELRTEDLRKEICPIFQDYLQFHLSAAENIWLGNVDLPNDSPRIIEAARVAGADEFIRRLPSSYQTTLGRMFPDGSELSGGQWQRLALARALFRDGQIVVLDEPTSSQDPQAEYEFFRHFRNLVETRVAMIISHRFSTVRMADRIYVLDEGTIVEAGSHDELLALRGLYASLFRLQAQAWQ